MIPTPMKHTETLEIDGEQVEWEYFVSEGEDGSVTVYRKWNDPPDQRTRRDTITLTESLLEKLPR